MEVEADGLKQQSPPALVLQLPIDPVLSRQREGVIIRGVDNVSEQPQVPGLETPQSTLLANEALNSINNKKLLTSLPEAPRHNLSL